MRTVRVSCAALAALLCACSIQRAEDANKAKQSMVGMSKEQILQCMGPPANRASVGSTEVWSYNSGNGHVDTFGEATATGGSGSATAFGSATSIGRSCKVDVVMSADRVTALNYTGHRRTFEQRRAVRLRR